jgi:hypothetical protein
MLKNHGVESNGHHGILMLLWLLQGTSVYCVLNHIICLTTVFFKCGHAAKESLDSETQWIVITVSGRVVHPENVDGSIVTNVGRNIVR